MDKKNSYYEINIVKKIRTKRNFVRFLCFSRFRMKINRVLGIYKKTY